MQNMSSKIINYTEQNVLYIIWEVKVIMSFLLPGEKVEFTNEYKYTNIHTLVLTLILLSFVVYSVVVNWHVLDRFGINSNSINLYYYLYLYTSPPFNVMFVSAWFQYVVTVFLLMSMLVLMGSMNEKVTVYGTTTRLLVERKAGRLGTTYEDIPYMTVESLAIGKAPIKLERFLSGLITLVTTFLQPDIMGLGSSFSEASFITLPLAVFMILLSFPKAKFSVTIITTGGRTIEMPYSDETSLKQLIERSREFFKSIEPKEEQIQEKA